MIEYFRFIVFFIEFLHLISHKLTNTFENKVNYQICLKRNLVLLPFKSRGNFPASRCGRLAASERLALETETLSLQAKVEVRGPWLPLAEV